VLLFGVAYFEMMSDCRQGSATCANHATPICVNTGLPPLAYQCPIICTQSQLATDPSPDIVCPDEHIPGSRVEVASNKKLGSAWSNTDELGSYAPVTPGRCGEDAGTIGYLCSETNVYLYAASGSQVNVSDVVTAAGITPAEIVVSDYGDSTCQNLNGNYAIMGTNYATSTFVITPAQATGQSVYYLCYTVTAGGTWQPLSSAAGGTVYVVSAMAGACSAYDCAGSDFNPALRYDHSFIDSMYFAMTVHSTVGFGDISPTTQRGMLMVVLQCLVVLAVGYF